MRRFACFFLMASAWGQTTQGPPTVRDTFVQTGNPRIVSLKDELYVVVCKTEYDAWQKDQKSAPALFLYMNGMLMKGPKAASPASAPPKPSDETTEKVKADCAKPADDAVAAAEKEAADKAAAAKEAAGKAATETDTNKKAAAVKEASDKDVLARDAATKAAAIKAAAQQMGDPRYVMRYYLDSQFVTDPDNKAPWIRLLQRPWQSGKVPVSVGAADLSPWPSAAEIEFERINVGWLLGWAALFVTAIILFVKYARRSDIIRDPGELPAPLPGTPARMKAYSLARTQMAVWTFLVAGALAFLFLVTWNENTISTGVLALIGISFSTTLLAATAEGVSPTAADVALAEKDAADKAAVAKEVADKAAETDSAKKLVADKEAAAKATAAKTAVEKAASVKAGIQVPQPTQHFLTDLLTEGTGPSFHRFQMVLFTVILAVIFVAKTANSLVMPEFDPTLLGLMGISSGTYLGFKLQGK